MDLCLSAVLLGFIKGSQDKQMNEQHIISYKQLLAVLSALLVLTAATVGASTIDVGGLHIWLTIFIATLKSSLVLLFFMHLKAEIRMIKATFLITIFIIGLLISFLFWDISFR